MRAFAPTGNIQKFREADGEVTLWFPAASMVAACVKGHIRAPTATAIYAAIDAYTASHGLPGIGFCDFEDLTEFDWEARMVLVRWNLKHRGEAQRFHMLVKSPIVQLALRLVSIVLGDVVVVHENRTTFEAAYRAMLAQQQ
jgi:hypothetical protein